MTWKTIFLYHNFGLSIYVCEDNTVAVKKTQIKTSASVHRNRQFYRISVFFCPLYICTYHVDSPSNVVSEDNIA